MNAGSDYGSARHPAGSTMREKRQSMIQSILEESDGNDDEYDQGRYQQKHRKGQGAAYDNFASPAPMKPVRGAKQHQTDAQKGR